MLQGNCLCGKENTKLFFKNIGGSLWNVCDECLFSG